ncbi:ARSB [Symbiodinium natans]|uniref:ARSB protein n=1 Tax=Symbiodinium natans TaxID=878477 RepID=A0A812LDP2_9DINO|nr:ARSB [Symbiodinium natans]
MGMPPLHLLISILFGQPVLGHVRPHILFVLVDDLGWADVGFHRDKANPEVVTPNLDSLVASGIHLNRHYVHHMCTPTRTSVQSGRLPVHVNTRLSGPCQDDTGIPYNMTGMAEKMKQAGYKTHYVGKWDAGMSTPQHTPHGRGYETSLNYFSHKNDFYNQSNMQTCCDSDPTIVDFWRTDRGASDVNGTGYSEFLYRQELVNIVQRHDPELPLFLFYAPHVAHCPLQVPESYYSKFAWMADDEDQCKDRMQGIPVDPSNPALEYKCRQQHAAMIMLMDEVVGNVTAALKVRNMWEDTLMIFSSDNGGPVRILENAANNWPLRGGKFGNFEGGIRATAFVSGGFLPENVRGSERGGIIHIADWYGTLCALAGVDASDQRAAAAGLPPIDSVDMWPYLSGAADASPRNTIPVGDTCLISGSWKLMTAATTPSLWQGPRYPNGSTRESEAETPGCSDGCLFNVEQDPTEQRNWYSLRPDIVASMSRQLQQLQLGFFENQDRFANSCPREVANCACWLARNRYGGFLGPYALLDPEIPEEAHAMVV